MRRVRAQSQDVFVMSESWMSIEEAKTWLDCAMQAYCDIHDRHSSILSDVKVDIYTGKEWRHHVADRYEEWSARECADAPHVARVYDFAAAILRAVKT